MLAFRVIALISNDTCLMLKVIDNAGIYFLYVTNCETPDSTSVISVCLIRCYFAGQNVIEFEKIMWSNSADEPYLNPSFCYKMFGCKRFFNFHFDESCD